MGYQEDCYVKIYKSIRELGIEEKFYLQIDKMKHQPKHKYKTTYEKWNYAYDKILQL